MRSQIDVLIDSFKQARSEAVVLSGRDHTPSQFGKYLTDTGSELEVFLKKSIYEGTKDNVKFYHLIQSLLPLGVEQDAVDSLDRLRDKYNAVKHDTAYQAPVQEVQTILADAEAALVKLKQHNLGTASQPAAIRYRRVLWWAAWDHYVGGDTEFQIYLPTSESAHYATLFDIIYIDAIRWDAVKQELTQAGEFGVGQQHVPAKFYETWKSEGDFLAAGMFAGDYRQFISILAKHERVEDLIPDLKRENAFLPMFGALLMAAVDVLRGNSPADDQAILAEQIGAAAASTYAAPRHSKIVTSLAPKVAEMLLKVPADLRHVITGPFWVTVEEFDKHKAEAVSGLVKPDVIVWRDGRLLVRV